MLETSNSSRQRRRCCCNHSGLSMTSYRQWPRWLIAGVLVTCTLTTVYQYYLSAGGTPDVVSAYVSFVQDDFADGRGLGNQMFVLAAVVHLAELTGRRPAILRHGTAKFRHRLALDEVFDLGVRHVAGDLCPCYVFRENASLAYDARVRDLIDGGGRAAAAARDKSILLSGFFQSWKYTLNVDGRLRRHFTFLPDVRRFVDEFVATSSRPPGWVDYVRVGVHVRRGDVTSASALQGGYTTPDEGYFERAVRYFVERFRRVQFLVACVDVRWCRRTFADLATLRPGVNVTLVTGRSRAEDFAVVASCDHVIMSTGTFGWWAAWLARGVTVYYADWPRNGSGLAKMFRREDFFPPDWIGMT